MSFVSQDTRPCARSTIDAYPERAERKADVHVSIRSLAAGVLCLIVIGMARPAAAQDVPNGTFSGGYQFFSGKGEGNDEEWENFPKGWYFDVTGNLTDVVGIVGQVSGNYKHFDDDDVDFNIHTFMGGVRTSTQGQVRAFGQFLVGGANFKASDDIDSVSETDFAIQFGAGVDVMGGGGVGLRVGADYLRVFAKDEGDLSAGEDVNGFRFVVGVVFGLGGR